ncbi:MAG: hypothetical protein AAF790_02235 [Planctomycetota bacterium]
MNRSRHNLFDKTPSAVTPTDPPQQGAATLQNSRPSDADPQALRRRAARAVIRAGASAASMAGYDAVIERSPGSESTYLHVHRRGVWWGFRVSCHRPTYDCCRDYEQVLFDLDRHPAGPDPAAVRRAAVWLAWRAPLAGMVVADPRAVTDAIDRLAAKLSDGRLYRDPAGVCWRWDAAAAAWAPATIDLSTGRPAVASATHRRTRRPNRLAFPLQPPAPAAAAGDDAVAASPSPPTHSGQRLIPPRVRCEVRHAMNVTARWAAELEASG